MGPSPPPWLTVNEIVHFCRGRFSSCPKRDRYQTLNIHVKISFQFWISHKGDAGCFTPQMLKLLSGDKYSYKGGIYLSEMSRYPCPKSWTLFRIRINDFFAYLQRRSNDYLLSIASSDQAFKMMKESCLRGATYSLHKCRVITWWNLMFIASLWVTLWVGGASTARTSLIFHTFPACIITLGFSVRHCYN